VGVAVTGADARAELALQALTDPLTGLASRMVTGRRDEDLAARIGGEEFAVILPGAGRAAACAVAERIRAAVSEREFPVAGTRTISCGVAHWEAGDDPATLMRRADANLYRAKAAGRDRVVCGGEPGS
jgi:two-component system, cell cycle response regulator